MHCIGHDVPEACIFTHTLEEKKKKKKRSCLSTGYAVRVRLAVATLTAIRDITELRSCVKVEVAVLGYPSLIVRTISVDVKQH